MIVIVGGVSGTGKSTVGQSLARRLDWPFVDGDRLHSAANIAKMRSGVALTDDDRWPWLRAIGDRMDDYIRRGGSAVVASSALKRSYRDLLTKGRPGVRIAFLESDQATLAARLRARHGHFFRAALLGSQFADLEPPQPDEGVLVVPATGAPDDIAADIARRLHLSPSGQPA
ncbi:MAG TPA: gluconokinase [Streptosporangiaceae bacterium]|jgi:gluconokinase|nr:gluconokinase [Streptosporangiaceae bacterium]